MILSLEEIKRQIASGEIKAISLDTSIFDQKQNGLEYGLLKRLQQFKGSEITFVLSDVVLQEVKSHILQSSIDSNKASKEVLKQVGNSWNIPRDKRNDVTQILLNNVSPEVNTQLRIDTYLETTGAIIIKADDYVSVAELVERYFGSRPPFGCNETKKHEFPDALAVLTLDAWAARSNIKMLVVTNDADWKRYCAESSHLVAIDDVAHALQSFQRETAQYTCQLLSEQLRSTDNLGIQRLIEDAIYNQDSKFDFYPEADSQFSFDWDWPDVALDYIGIHGVEVNDTLMEPIEFGDNYLVALIKVNVSAEVSCDFSFSIYDSIDKDYVPMGSSTASTTHEFVAEVLVTFEGPMPNCTEIVDIEVVKQRVDVDFGTVEPDWRDDHHEDEY